MASAERKKLAEAQAEAQKHLPAVRAELLKLPNVVAVGIGLKETAGKFTKQLCYRVYVRKKLAEGALGEGVIPKTIAGLPTDVLTPIKVTEDSDVCGDERRDTSTHRPLRAGIGVSRHSGNGGTLGWFGTLQDGSLVLISNEHVLYKEALPTPNRKVKKVGQPRIGKVSKCCCCECGSDNVIAETVVGIKDDPDDPTVDVALARVHASLVPDVLFEITNDNTDEVLTVSGHADAVVGETVRKVGARSGFTRGIVIHIGDMAQAPLDPDGSGTVIDEDAGNVLIIPADDETYEVSENDECKRAFSNSGDSGAVILNEDDEIIALNRAGSREDYSVAVTIACRIQVVLDALAAANTPITLSKTSDGGDRDRAKLPRIPIDRDAEWFVRARDENQGSALYDLVMRHQHEVVRLVNHKRAVTVAWQRNKGPAFVAALTRSGRVARYRVPMEVEGVTREQLLLAMERALRKHGSAELKRDMERYRQQALEIALRGRSVTELAELLRASGLIDRVPGTLLRNAS